MASRDLSGTDRPGAASTSAAMVVEEWLTAVGDALPGPRRWRGDVLAELRDGLYEATHRHAATVPDDVGAARAAVAEFGDPDRIAAGFADESAARVSRRVAAGVLASGPVVAGSWLAAIATSDAPPWHGTLAGPWRLMPALGGILALVIPAAVLALLATGGRASLWLSRWPRLAPMAAATAARGCGFGDVLMLTIFSAWIAAPSAVAWPVVGWAAAVSGTRLLLATAAVRRCGAARARLR
jgi:hypothetical protein